MDNKVVDLAQYRKPNDADEGEALEMLAFMDSLPTHFNIEHCASGREALGWSVEALSFRSRVSIRAIKAFEAGERELREVTLRALAYCMEDEGLIFLRGHSPLRGNNFRGATNDPRERADYHLLE
jgi:hypothetical protein